MEVVDVELGARVHPFCNEVHERFEGALLFLTIDRPSVVIDGASRFERDPSGQVFKPAGVHEGVALEVEEYVGR